MRRVFGWTDLKPCWARLNRSSYFCSGTAYSLASDPSHNVGTGGEFIQSWMGEPDSPHKHPSRDVPPVH
ncbi:hypothetical protein R3I93_017324 [Phoxinus phoxinus]|uniref:Uncharacterized protein n=1 Tax=Phoxinus phoxinus TaxID=58324 RepID=A0AAN9CI92_9TELE